MHQRKKEDGEVRDNFFFNLEEPKGSKNISNINSAKKRILIPKIRKMEGETTTTRRGIADVHGEFYAKTVRRRRCRRRCDKK